MLLVDLSGRNWRAVNSRRHFERLRAARVRGALIKATEGATFVNERYRAYRRWALDVGMLVGRYHFAYPSGDDAQEEAEHFIRTVGKLDQLRPVLDLEIDPGVQLPDTGESRAVVAELCAEAFSEPRRVALQRQLPAVEPDRVGPMDAARVEPSTYGGCAWRRRSEPSPTCW
jgi:Glycosyl hydrolases family 25